MIDHLPHILAAYGVFLLGVMTPGPNVLAIIGTSMARSRREGVAMALGVGTGSFLWSSLSVLGLTLVLSAHAEVALLLRIVGGAYLMWLGGRSLWSARHTRPLAVRAVGAALPWRRAWLGGLAVQATNPKAALFWLSIMSLVLVPDAPSSVGIAIVLGTTVISFAWHTTLALAFSTRYAIDLYGRARRGIEAVLGAYFCLLGGRLILSQ